MLLKHCVHCRHGIMPQSAGLEKYFCSKCTQKCHEVYETVKNYLPYFQEPSAPEISLKLNVPQVFVVHALRMAGVVPDLSRRNVVEQRQCTVCHARLEHFENVYCSPCDEMIAQRLHSRYRNKEGASSPYFRPR